MSSCQSELLDDFRRRYEATEMAELVVMPFPYNRTMAESCSECISVVFGKFRKVS
jgi:hypothetical protein